MFFAHNILLPALKIAGFREVDIKIFGGSDLFLHRFAGCLGGLNEMMDFKGNSRVSK
jgi:hypothetical protein